VQAIEALAQNPTVKVRSLQEWLATAESPLVPAKT
jgi:hypothetical protein